MIMRTSVLFRADQTVAHIAAEAQRRNLPIYTNQAGEFALFSHHPDEGGWQLYGADVKFGVACRDDMPLALDDFSHEAEVVEC